jgi:glucokinase
VSGAARLLAGDIGGTKTILALFAATGGDLTPVREETFASRDYASFDLVLAEARRRVGAIEADAVCIGVAGPVIDGRCRTTNLPWELDEKDLARELRCSRVKLLNDLEATAYGMLHLRATDLVTLNEGSAGLGRGHVAVIAAGTGLGQAYLYWDGETHQPLASEGGHADFAPRTDLEVELLRYLRAELGGRVSVERVLSGPGIHRVYCFLRDTGREREPDWLAAELAAGDPSAVISRSVGQRGETICSATLELFSEIYGAEAGNMALRALTYGGVYVGGGIAPKNLAVLSNGSFLRGFTDKGQFSSLLRSLPVRISLDPETALLGSAQYARHLAASTRG